MGQECSGLKGSQSEHNCVTDRQKFAKTGQNWPKIAQTMAIFHHKWLILWRKKIIFINIQLPMGSGQHLIPFGYLEVPLPAACSLVWRALWNRPAPLSAENVWAAFSGIFPQTCSAAGITRGLFDCWIQYSWLALQPEARILQIPSNGALNLNQILLSSLVL